MDKVFDLRTRIKGITGLNLNISFENKRVELYVYMDKKSKYDVKHVEDEIRRTLKGSIPYGHFDVLIF